MNRRDVARSALVWTTFGALMAAAALTCLAAPPATAKACVEPRHADDVAYDLVMAVLVDDTQERTDSFKQKVVEAVAAVARKPRVRLVLWRFGGVKALPALLADVNTLSTSSRKQDLNWLVRVATRPEGSDDADRACTEGKAEEVRNTFLGRLKVALDVYDGSEEGASPVVLAVDQAVAPFVQGQPAVLLKVLLVSDGLEHGGKGSVLSFYPVNNQYPPAAEALAKVASLYKGSTWRGAQISIAGIGVTRTSDPAGVGALVDIWKAIITTARSGSVGELSTSVPQRLAESPPAPTSAGGK